MSQTQITELQEENELLLLQLHQVQEELEFYFLKYQELEQNGGSRAKHAGWQPSAVTYDLRNHILGDNWWDIEVDGRWAGPEKTSVLNLPGLEPGEYWVELHVVDTIQPEILNGLSLQINDQNIVLTELQSKNSGLFKKPARLPATLKGRVHIADKANLWKLTFNFPKTVTPANAGKNPDDHRALAIRLQSVRFKRINNESAESADFLHLPKAEDLAAHKHFATLEKRNATLESDQKRLITARDEHAKLASDRLNQINTLNTEKSQLTQLRDELTKRRDQMTKAQDEANRQIQELKVQLESLNKDKATLSQEKAALIQDKASLSAARDEHAKLASDRLNQINTLNTEKSQLTQLLNEQTNGREELATLSRDRLQQINSLNNEMAERNQKIYSLEKHVVNLKNENNELIKETIEIKKNHVKSLLENSNEEAILEYKCYELIKTIENKFIK